MTSPTCQAIFFIEHPGVWLCAGGFCVLRSRFFSTLPYCFALGVSLSFEVQSFILPADKPSRRIAIWNLIGVTPESHKASVGFILPLGAWAGSAESLCPTLPQGEHPYLEMHPKGRQVVQPGRKVFYQKQKKLKRSGKEVLFLEKLALREGEQPSFMMIGFLYRGKEEPRLRRKA